MDQALEPRVHFSCGLFLLRALTSRLAVLGVHCVSNLQAMVCLEWLVRSVLLVYGENT